MIWASLLFLCSAGTAFAEEPASPLARAVVHSKEWKITRSPEKTEEFIGDVSYWGSGSSFHSDWAFYRHAARLWRARGNVKGSQRLANGDRIQVFGDKASYDQGAEKGELLGDGGKPVRFLFETADGEYEKGEAAKLLWEGSRFLFLRSNVHIEGSRLEAWAGKADLDARERTLRLTRGRPVLRVKDGAWRGALTAEVISAWQSSDAPTAAPRRRGAAAVGQVRGWIVFKKK